MGVQMNWWIGARIGGWVVLYVGWWDGLVASGLVGRLTPMKVVLKDFNFHIVRLKLLH